MVGVIDMVGIYCILLFIIDINKFFFFYESFFGLDIYDI